MNKELFDYIANKHKKYCLDNQDDLFPFSTFEEYNNEISKYFEMVLTNEEKQFAFWNWNIGVERAKNVKFELRHPREDEEFLEAEKEFFNIFSKIDAKEIYIYSKRTADFFNLFPSDNANSNIENEINNDFKEKVSTDNVTVSNINKSNQTNFNLSEFDIALRNNDFKLAFILIHKEIKKIAELINSKKVSHLLIDDINFELSPLETEIILTRKKKLLEKQAQELLTKL